MRNRLFTGAVVAMTFLSLAAKSDDPVLMKINNKDIKKSEFEYLYHKNNQQQIEKQSLDKYLDMFVLYKLKVADAEAAGIDTTKAFLTEFRGYQADLMRPYLEDSSVIDQMIKDNYERYKEDVDVSHIMIPVEGVGTDRAKQKRIADSLRNCILEGQSFEDIAMRYSIDPAVKNNKGRMGFISAGKFPYTFEDAAYTTPVGAISEPVATDYGFHIIKVNARRPSKGSVLVKHIMKLIPRKATPEEAEQKKAQMDSIYKLIIAGADFEELAKKESDDTGSARKGGELPWFGTGEMVREFEKVSFDLPKDSISKPFATAYGIHIVKKIDSKGVEPFEVMAGRIRNTIMNDERGTLPRTKKIESLKKEFNLKVNQKFYDQFIDEINKSGGIDSVFISRFADSDETLFTYADKKEPLKTLINRIKGYGKMSVSGAKRAVDQMMEIMQDDAVLDQERSLLPQKYPEYRNLINEYRDGMLLFEISNRKVWDGASKDKEGLEAYFQANKSKYKWDAPKYKGLLIQVTNDSIAEGVKNSLKTLGNDTVVKALRDEFGKNIRIEKVLVAKGDNAKVDALVFGVKPESEKADSRFPVCFVANGEIISAPQEAADVRGQVTADYQNVLEDKWVSELKAKYPVKINKNVLKKIK